MSGNPSTTGWGSRPTPEEINAHHTTHAKGNVSWWVTIYPDEVEKGRNPYVWYSMGKGVVWADGGSGQPSDSALWSPRDARLMPVAWPVTK